MKVRSGAKSMTGGRLGEPRGWRRELWDQLANSRRRLLMFDYDGTLAPFRVDRTHAMIPPATRRVLRRLGALPDHSLAIVSGRSMSELARLVGRLPIHLIGEHGWEQRPRARPVLRATLSAASAIALARAAARIEQLGLAGHLERKRTAVVLHVRGMAARRARTAVAAAIAAWRPLRRAGRLRLDEIVGGVELRALGHDKGEMVRRLMARRPRPDLAVYIGDDTTDEDAFAALNGHGIGIRVGIRHRFTRAHGTLASPAAVCGFLAEWWQRAAGR